MVILAVVASFGTVMLYVLYQLFSFIDHANIIIENSLNLQLLLLEELRLPLVNLLALDEVGSSSPVLHPLLGSGDYCHCLGVFVVVVESCLGRGFYHVLVSVALGCKHRVLPLMEDLFHIIQLFPPLLLLILIKILLSSNEAQIAVASILILQTSYLVQ
jgi:hypothetical protein